MDRGLVKRSLDELFTLARQYRSGPEFKKLLDFVARFRFYAPYNAMLVHVQMPGATFVAPPSRWLWDYKRTIKAGSRPLVILRPMGPVMFVFDVSDTEAMEGAPPLPKEVTDPFEVRGGQIGPELEMVAGNAKRDGVEVTAQRLGSQSAGQIETVWPPRPLAVTFPGKSEPGLRFVPLQYALVLNASHSREAQFATLAHELAHLYCGHLGTPNDRWWPAREHLDLEAREFEAESVCYLVCGRLGIDNPSEEYLSGYLQGHPEVPNISLECVMKAAGLIEQMGCERLKPRKEAEK